MDLRYPIGKFERAKPVTPESLPLLIADIETTPAALRSAVSGLNDQQLDTPYRDGGWTVRQVIHHVADSHINSFVRLRLALTEDVPTIKAYDEKKWADLADSRTFPVEPSLQLLDSLHARWVMLLRSMGADDFSRTFRHPEAGFMRLDTNLALYAWHGKHHVAHITALRERLGW